MAVVVFPPFSETEQSRIGLLLKMLSKNPTLLSQLPDTYADVFKRNLSDSLGLAARSTLVETQGEDGEPVDILLQIEAMITQINNIQLESAKLDPAERVSMMKNQMALFEKWVSVKEKALNLKEMSEFQQVVISFIDEVLTPSQRTDFINRLRPFQSLAGNGGVQQ